MSDPTYADILIDNIPVQPEDKSTWLQRFASFIKGGGPFGTAQPGQRGTFVPSRINEQGQPELAVPGIVQQPAESLQALMTAPLSDIVRSGDRDAIRAASEASFDVASMLPAAGVAATKAAPKTAGQRAMVAASNPDDLNTSAILAALSGMDQPGRMTGEDVLRATTKRPANVNEPGLAQLQPGPQDTTSFRGFQQGEVKPLYDGQPPQDVGERLFSQIAAKAKDTYDVLDAAEPIFRRLQGTYGATVMAGISKLPKEQAARMLQSVFDGVKAAGEIQGDRNFVLQRYDVALVPQAERTAWMADGSRTTLLVGTKATTDDITRAIKSRINPKTGNWKPFDGVYSNPDDPTTAAILAAMQGQERPKGITAYHGSPHDFDRFDLSKIGTGEGAQAYGHGLYFAENEGVARSYRDALADAESKAKWAGEPLTLEQLRSMEAQAKGDIREHLIGTVADAMAKGKSFDEALRTLNNDGIRNAFGDSALAYPGRMYEVRINADPDRFIDFDLQHNEQSSFVNEALAKARAQGRFPEAPRRYIPRTPEETNALRDAGIPGIRYLDQGSRGAGEGSRNYVVFDDALVEILRKYANAPDPTTAAILALLTQQAEKPSAGMKVYRGGDDGFSPSKHGRYSGLGAFSVSTSEQAAKKYGSVQHGYLKPDAKILDIPKEFATDMDIRRAKLQGYDAIRTTNVADEELIIINSASIQGAPPQQ